jgi:hypothetical protein
MFVVVRLEVGKSRSRNRDHSKRANAAQWLIVGVADKQFAHQLANIIGER